MTRNVGGSGWDDAEGESEKKGGLECSDGVEFVMNMMYGKGNASAMSGKRAKQTTNMGEREIGAKKTKLRQEIERKSREEDLVGMLERGGSDSVVGG